MCLSSGGRLTIWGETQILWVTPQQEDVQGQRNHELRQAQHDQGGAPSHMGYQRPGERDADRRGEPPTSVSTASAFPRLRTNQFATTVKVTG